MPPQFPTLSRRSFLQAGLLAALAAGAKAPTAFALDPPPEGDAFRDPVYHFLNRITWSVRPADLSRAQRLGVSAYLAEQLSPAMVRKANLVAVPRVLALPRRAIYRLKDPYGMAGDGLIAGMIQRAVVSPAQLYERMVEFWSDHFNIAMADLEPEVVDWQRTVIRPNALGKFRTLLQATARHPAMLYYLDNAYSNKEHPNENYGRELMELHTLGVDSGYTEADVKAVARAFTGWTTDYGNYTGFVFDPDLHDTDEKIVLGQTIPGRDGMTGMQEGVEVLNLLASDPRTARFLCKKLCTRFISDAYSRPGAAELAVINSLAAVWQSSDGDIRTVLTALFSSEAFADSAQKKLRRPLDFLIAVRRATGTVYTNADEQQYHAEVLDQVPYGWGPPNGYPDVAAAWATTSSLLGRWSVAQDLTNYALPGNGQPYRAVFQRRLRGVRTVGELVDRLSQNFFAATLPETARAALVAYVTDGASGAETVLTPDLLRNKLGGLAGLVLSQPNFQWR